MNQQTSKAQGAIQKQSASVTLVQAIGLLREEKDSINQELAALPAVQWLEARGRDLANREQELHITIDVLGRMFQERAVGNAADACDAALAAKAKQEDVRSNSPLLDELAMLVRKLVQQLRKAAPGNESAEKAVDYLKRKGLAGNPLRDVQQPKDRAEFEACEAAFKKDFCPYSGNPDPWVVWQAAWKAAQAKADAQFLSGFA